MDTAVAVAMPHAHCPALVVLRQKYQVLIRHLCKLYVQYITGLTKYYWLLLSNISRAVNILSNTMAQCQRKFTKNQAISGQGW